TGGIHGQPNPFHKIGARQLDLLSLFSDWIDQFHRDRTFGETVEDRAELLWQAGKCLPAKLVSGAVGEQKVHGVLCATRKKQRLIDVGRGHAYQHDRAQALRMLPHVNLSSEGAIRGATKVDRAVPEGGAHLVKVVHGNGRCVEPEVGDLFKLLPALDPLVAREQLAKEILCVFRIVFQVKKEGVRTAGPSLVDENEIALLAAPSQDASLSQSDGTCSRSARSAVQPEDGIRRGRLTQGFEDDDLEFDHASGRGGTVFKDLIGPATGLAFHPW